MKRGVLNLWRTPPPWHSISCALECLICTMSGVERGGVFWPAKRITETLSCRSNMFSTPAPLILGQERNEKPKGNKVVIIGGGYAGIEAAKGLDKAFDVALVAGGESFRHVMYGLRASILPEQTARMLVSFDNLLKNGTVKTCKEQDQRRRLYGDPRHWGIGAVRLPGSRHRKPPPQDTYE